MILQTTAAVHGALKLVVSDEDKRMRADRKLTSDLGSLERLASGTMRPE